MIFSLFTNAAIFMQIADANLQDIF